jgi:PPP family 3-phenylpropionic acid transporter
MIWRLRLNYIAYFTATGLMIPYFSVWLAWRGLDPTTIGIVNGAMAAIRVLSGPLLGTLADRSGDRRMVLRIVAPLSLLVFALYGVVDGSLEIVAISTLFGAIWAGVLPLGDSLAIAAAYRAGLDFGRIRLWGSIAFVAASVIGGLVLDGRSTGLVFWMLLASYGLVIAGAWWLPAGEAVARPRAARGPLFTLLREPLFVLFIAGNGLAQASHAMIYAFGSIHWRNLGFSEDVIGLLWAEGVIAEIVLFAGGAAVLARIGPHGLMVIGAGAGLVRWTGLAFADQLWQLVLLQALHGLTFGASYLGQMHFLARAVAPGSAASAQSLVAAAGGGLGMGIGFMAAGPLYDAFGGTAFLAMTLFSGFGAVVAVYLARRWGGRTVG